jgi:ATP-dependent 26S proteasome regulatory subunit
MPYKPLTPVQKRPSRFDRKYLFPDPNTEQRVAYCRFWQNKLAGNKEIEFPDELCEAIADITDSFSYAYMQEAFVSALLALARKTGKDDDDSSDAEAVVEEMADGWLEVRALDGRDLDRLVLWVEIKKQIEILREGMENTA